MEVENILGSDHFPVMVEICVGRGRSREKNQGEWKLADGVKDIKEMGERLREVRWEEIRSIEEMETRIV